MTSEEYAALKARAEALSPKGQELLHGMFQIAMEVADKAREAGKQEERERAKRIVSDVRECDLYQIRDVRASRFACDEILRRLEAGE